MQALEIFCDKLYSMMKSDVLGSFESDLFRVANHFTMFSCVAKREKERERGDVIAMYLEKKWNPTIANAIRTKILGFLA